MNETDTPFQEPNFGVESKDSQKSWRKVAQENLRIAVEAAYAADADEKSERIIVPATEVDLVKFASHSDLAGVNGSIGTNIWKILARSASQYAGNFQGQYRHESDSSEVSEVYLTQQLVDLSKIFEGMGPKRHAVLEEYFKVGLDKLSDKPDSSE
ncbi:MAG TPA: hypothetical protein PKC86_01205 [Candidatus Saccharibacteria bacterium]|nr:hypothetical protein [Candidatus Saccharibacteria bacterium]HRN96973.1 hypothetical protein [Candidatus Saccharibacteria bacterium]HRQ07144.1 hypothetical protein [Candidatus Saccharibacteria bacterium]